MNLNAYQDQLEQFDKSSKKLWYHTLGLVGESGELLDKMMVPTWRTGAIAAVDALILEAGDVLWYIGRIGQLLGLSFDDLLAIKRAGRPLHGDEMMACLEVVKSASIVADKMKKVYRDDGWKFDADLLTIDEQGRSLYELKDDHQAMVVCHLSDTLHALQNFGNCFSVTLTLIGIKNFEKLSSRMNRGTLKGNGDNR